LYFNHFITLLLTLLNTSKPGCKATAAELLTETASASHVRYTGASWVGHPKQTVCNELGAPVPYTHWVRRVAAPDADINRVLTHNPLDIVWSQRDVACLRRTSRSQCERDVTVDWTLIQWIHAAGGTIDYTYDRSRDRGLLWRRLRSTISSPATQSQSSLSTWLPVAVTPVANCYIPFTYWII